MRSTGDTGANLGRFERKVPESNVRPLQQTTTCFAEARFVSDVRDDVVGISVEGGSVRVFEDEDVRELD